MKKTTKVITMGLLALFIGRGSWADISNTASTTFKDALNNSYNATSNTTLVTVVTAPILTLVKSASPSSVVTGGQVTFTINYTNSGGAASSVVITDVIPTGSTLVAGSITAPIGVTSSVSGNTISWTVGNVAAGASGSVTFKVTAN